MNPDDKSQEYEKKCNEHDDAKTIAESAPEDHEAVASGELRVSLFTSTTQELLDSCQHRNCCEDHGWETWSKGKGDY